jgi:[protein-PII] uridylyltransferase
VSEAPLVSGHLPPEGAAAGVEALDLVRAVRSYLEAARAHLEKLHRETRSGRATNERCAELTDRLVQHLFALAVARARPDPEEPVCLCAVGGYGRREMSVHSDVDLLVLHREPLSAAVGHVAEQVQYALWDAGLAVGCAIRTADETGGLAREDTTVATAILEARWLGGEPGMLALLRQEVERQVLTDPAGFIEAQRDLRRERHSKFGESLYLLQPNLKEGAGGLRDYHSARWAMRVAHPDASAIEDLGRLGLLTEAELRELEEALDFLWWVRNELHLVHGRRTDQMSFAHQEEVARAFGFVEEEGGDLPVERFMGSYYRHARVVDNLSSLVIDQCLARAKPFVSPPVVHEVEDGFRRVGDHLEIPSVDHLRERPLRLLTVFAVAQDHQVPLSRTAMRMVRENLDVVNDDLRVDPRAGQALFRILASEHRVFRTLTAMNEVGLLGRYLPEWEHIVCRWQHVMYHTYTVDVHTTFLVEELRRLWRGKYERALPEMTDLVREVQDRVVLFLGCVFHDIGKGLGGGHSRKGVEITGPCLKRLGLEPERAERVLFLVAQHLYMSHVAQRRDLSDPRVIVEFARMVGDRVNLRNLYLTSEFLETGSDDPSRALEQIEAEVSSCQAEARTELQALGLAEARTAAYFASMPRRYFVSHTPQEVARHALLVSGYRAERRLAIAVRELAEGTTELLVCTPDVPALYSKVAGTLTSRALNILGSSVYTMRGGLALEVYRITTPRGGAAERRLAWSELEEILGEVLAGRRDLEEAIQRRQHPVGRQDPPVSQPSRVRITNTESDFYTIVDVTTNDRLGLLYDLTRTLAEHGFEVFVSKAGTILDQVADTFYVKAARHKKVTDPERLAALEAGLRRIVTETPDG